MAAVHSGVLHKLGGGSLHVWQPRFCEVVGKEVRYYEGTAATKTGYKGSVPVEGATIHDRGCAAGDKPCFSIGPGAVAKKGGKEYFFAADSAASKYEWIAALMLACGNPVYDALIASSGDTEQRAMTLERIADSALGRAGVLRKRGNEECADCGADLPTWVVVSPETGAVVCIECIGVHRKLWSTHCKEVQLDQWTDAEVDVIRSRGNDAVNAELEFLVGFDTPKPLPASSPAVREEFIRAKYLARKFTKAATGGIAPRAPQRDIAARAVERGLAVTVPPKYMGVLFIVLQRVSAPSAAKAGWAPDAQAVVANGFQHIVSKKGAPVAPPEAGVDAIQWNETLQLATTHPAAPITVSIMDDATAPHTATATFTVVPAALGVNADMISASVTGDIARTPRAAATLNVVISLTRY